MSKGKNIAVWSLTVALALVFVAAGAFKLAGAREAIDNHRRGCPWAPMGRRSSLVRQQWPWTR